VLSTDRPGRGTVPVTIESDVAATMRDGVVLRADVFRPAGSGPRPVLVCRTPYGKQGQAFGYDYPAVAAAIAAGGYVVVVQDTRGRYASDGEFIWIYDPRARAQEDADGYDTVEWASSLSGGDGRVGVWGNSYDGHTGLCALSADPPALQAGFVSGVAPTMLHETCGIYRPIYLPWAAAMALDMRRRDGDRRWPRTLDEVNAGWAQSSGKWLWWLPFETLPDELLGPLNEPHRDLLGRQTVDPWQLDDIGRTVDVPVRHRTGWWDYVSRPTVAVFQGLQSANPGLQHQLVIGPWGHNVSAAADSEPSGAFGQSGFRSYSDEVVRWYDSRFGDAEMSSDGAAVEYFVLNLNEWRTAGAWPVEGAAPTSLFLDSHGHANTWRGDGLLTWEQPEHSHVDRFDYDPRDPVMSQDDWRAKAAGLDDSLSIAADQSSLRNRQDILVYVSEPLAADLLVVGDPELVLWAASTAPDTDFAAKLVEVRPNGAVNLISHGIIRARYRHGYDSERFLDRDEPEEFVIRMAPVAILIGRGSQIRVDVTSSDFPNFDRNHNTGKPFWCDPELRIARQTVLHDQQRPSRLVLPVLEEEG
jgi:putative CocE/NonD family hydrolase